MYALDTNTLIYFFKGFGEVAPRLLSTPPTSIAIPAVVLYEIETGIAKARQPETHHHQFSQLLDCVPVRPFDRHTVREAASIRARPEQNGTPIGPLEALIAATAVATGGILVTHNTRAFMRVPGLPIVDRYQ